MRFVWRGFRGRSEKLAVRRAADNRAEEREEKKKRKKLVLLSEKM